MSENRKITVKTLAGCALLTSISVVLSRLIIPMPNETTRFSLESAAMFLAGMLFGPVPGMMVGFCADFIGCLLSPYGFNPLFCVPPILYGLCGGLFRPMLLRKTSLARIALAFAPAIVFGSVVYQSAALALVYGGEAFLPFFLAKLLSRGIQFGITLIVNSLIVCFLYRTDVLFAVHLWPSAKKEAVPNDRP